MDDKKLYRFLFKNMREKKSGILLSDFTQHSYAESEEAAKEKIYSRFSKYEFDLELIGEDEDE